jgi:16S rRNA (guanine527-N7)-methyltransferase
VAGQEALATLAPYEQWLTRPISEVASDLESFSQLLQKWQRIQNLVSRETLATLWTRHIADSLQILSLVGDAANFLDFGSGGGFPSLPLAIALKGKPRFVLIDSNSRKVSFLRAVARDLSLNVTVLSNRSDAIDPRETLPPDVITARALASLNDLCGMMMPFFTSQTRALLHKGREYVEELAETDARWRFDVIEHPSVTDSGGVILELSNLSLKTK